MRKQMDEISTREEDFIPDAAFEIGKYCDDWSHVVN